MNGKERELFKRPKTDLVPEICYFDRALHAEVCQWLYWVGYFSKKIRKKKACPSIKCISHDRTELLVEFKALLVKRNGFFVHIMGRI